MNDNDAEYWNPRPAKLPRDVARLAAAVENDPALFEKTEEKLPGDAPPVAGEVPTWRESARKWPDSLAPQAFHGLAGEVVRAVEPHTEADPAALLVQFLVGFGNMVGRGPYTRVEADRHTANLFAAIVGVSSKGRKGTAWGHVRRVLAIADPAWAQERIQSGLSSGEGLIWGVRDPIEKQQPIREKNRVVGYQNVIEDAGVSDKRLFVLETELASPLRAMAREGSTLSPVIRQAWDTGDLRVLTKNSPAHATGAHISIVAHVTRDELLRFLTATEQGNGFGNRFLWVCATRSKLLPEGGRIGSVDFSEIARRLTEAAARARGAGEVLRDGAARKMWCEVYGTLAAAKPGLFGCITSRAEAQVLRLALVYALLDGAAGISERHLLAALAVWQYCEDSARFIFGDSLGYPDADRILAALRLGPDGMTRTEVRDLFGRNRSEAEISAALAALAENGLARSASRDTGGRRAEVWLAPEWGTTKTTKTTEVG